MPSATAYCDGCRRASATYHSGAPSTRLWWPCRAMSSHVERLASGQDDQDMALQANERSLGGGCGPMFPGTRALEGGPKKMGRDARHYCDRRWSKHPTGTPMMGGGACRRWPGGGGVEVACSSMQRGPSLAVQLAARVQCVQCAVCSVQCAVCPSGREAWTRRAPSSAAAAPP